MSALKNPNKRQTIKEDIIKMIRRESLRPGDQILTQQQLASRYGVNPLTVGKALSDLCAENLLYREQGRGTFVGPRGAKSKTRKICLALPDKDLDQPENNPQCWPYVHQWFKTFMEHMNQEMSFSTIIVPYNDASEAVLERTSSYDLTFFLSYNGYEELIAAMLAKKLGRPAYYGLPHDNLPCLSVARDEVADTTLGFQYLRSLGHRKIALLSSDAQWYELPLQVHREVMGNAETSDQPFHGGGDFETALGRIAKHMPFDVVYCRTRLEGMRAIEFFRRNRIAVPDDVCVIANEGLEFMADMPPYLTCVLSPHAEIIAHLLNSLEKQPPPHPEHAEFPGKLHLGETCRNSASNRRLA